MRIIFTGGEGVRLVEVAHVSLGHVGADFYVQRRGTKAGQILSETEQVVLYHWGVTVKPSWIRRLDPRFLRYVMEDLYFRGYWQQAATQGTIMPHITKRTLESVYLFRT